MIEKLRVKNVHIQPSKITGNGEKISLRKKLF